MGGGAALQAHQSVISPGSYGTLPVPVAVAAYSSAANNSSSSNSSSANTQSQLAAETSINSSTSSAFNSNVENSIASSCPQMSQWSHTKGPGTVPTATTATHPGHAQYLPSHFPSEAQVSI